MKPGNWMRISLAGAISLVALLPVSAAPRPWRLVWGDEFNGAAGAPPDSAKWAFDLGGDGWGNQELEVYTDSRENSYQDGQGNLVIQALKSSAGQFTSARLKTLDKFSIRYGRIEARIKVPYGQGMWPAFWMLGDDFASARWPACGEIDIMENIGREPATVHGTVHGPGYSGANGIGKALDLDSGRFADDYHVYAVEWSAGRLDFFVDSTHYFTITPSSLPAGTKWVYDHPMFLIVNVAVGGSWPGNPDTSTSFPQKMLLDYVRVYKRNSIIYKRKPSD
jgi:beta-glucanase (GH16 family)